MDDGITVTVPGVRDLIAELKALNEDVARKTVRQAIREAGQYIMLRVRANAPLDTGKLRGNIDVVTRWKNRTGILQAKVRIHTRGKADDPRNAFYWRFLHQGFRPGGGSKKVEPDDFLVRTQREVQVPVTTKFYAAIERALARHGRRRA